MPYKNKVRQRAAWNRWYHKNSKKKMKWQSARRKRLRRWIDNYKSKLKCSRCQEKHPACLQFHHKDRKLKEGSIGDAKRKDWSIEKTLKEIKKCEVLCANCHAKEHFRV